MQRRKKFLADKEGKKFRKLLPIKRQKSIICLLKSCSVASVVQ